VLAQAGEVLLLPARLEVTDDQDFRSVPRKRLDRALDAQVPAPGRAQPDDRLPAGGGPLGSTTGCATPQVGDAANEPVVRTWMQDSVAPSTCYEKRPER
jgi:hypothetical protein